VTHGASPTNHKIDLIQQRPSFLPFVDGTSNP
jgi:hypothetical protein